MIVETVSLPPAGAIARLVPDVRGRGQSGPDFLTVLETVEDMASAASEVGGKAVVTQEPQMGDGRDPAIPPDDQVLGPPLGLPAPSPVGPAPARGCQTLPPQAPRAAPVEAQGMQPDRAPTPGLTPRHGGALAQAMAGIARSLGPAPSARAAVPDLVPVDPATLRAGDGGNGSPATRRAEGLSGREAPGGATLSEELPSSLARGDAIPASSVSTLLPAGPRGEELTAGMMTRIPPLKPRPEIPYLGAGADRAGPLNLAPNAPDRTEILTDPAGRDPLAGEASDTAQIVRATASSGPSQLSGPDDPAPAGVFAGTEGADPAGGGSLAPEPAEAAKAEAEAIPAQARADPPQSMAIGPASPRWAVLAGAEATVRASRNAAQAPAASAPKGDDAGEEPPDPALLGQPAGSRSVPEAIESGALSSGRSETKPEVTAAPLVFAALSVDASRGDPLPDGASTIPWASGTRAPEDGAGSGAPLPAQDPGRSVAMQLAAAVSMDRPGAFEIRLSPEELGMVKLTLQVADGTVALAIEAERPETLELMRRSLDVLEREFRDAGFTSLNLSFGDRGGDRQPAAPAVYAAADEDRPTSAGSPPPGDPAPMPRPPSSAQLDLRL